MTGPLLLLALLVGVFGLATCLADLQRGFLVCVAVGFLQDPIRKLVPGEPVYFVTTVVLFAIVTFVGAKLRGVSFSARRLHLWRSRPRRPILFFIAIVVLQSCAVVVSTGQPALGGIGLLAYLAPFGAVLLASRYARTSDDILRFIKCYLLFSGLMLSGLYLSFMGFEWSLLRSVGTELYVYVAGGALRLLPGFMRAPEVAAWHAATSACFLIILTVSTAHRRSIGKPMMLMVGYFLGAVILTARRKVFVEIGLFVLCYAWFLFYFRQGASKLVSRLVVLCIVLVALSQGVFSSERTVSGLSPYLQRGRSTAGYERAFQALDDIEWVIVQNGFFGSGAGGGSQGAQHFGGGDVRVGGSAESGPAKVLAELGVPGFLIALWMAGSVGRYLLRLMRLRATGDRTSAGLMYGFVAFLIANAGVFMAYHQIFGDPFVLLILGWILGFMLSGGAVIANATSVLGPSSQSPVVARRGLEPLTPGVAAAGRFSR